VSSKIEIKTIILKKLSEYTNISNSKMIYI